MSIVTLEEKIDGLINEVRRLKDENVRKHSQAFKNH